MMGRGRFADVQFIESTQLISLRQPTGQKKVPEIISQTVVPAVFQILRHAFTQDEWFLSFIKLSLDLSKKLNEPLNRHEETQRTFAVNGTPPVSRNKTAKAERSKAVGQRPEADVLGAPSGPSASARWAVRWDGFRLRLGGQCVESFP